MAAEHPEKDLCEEVTCSICLEYFRDPVTTDCDHNFCRGCLKRCWGRANGRLASCPQCRATIKHKNLRRNQKLANIVEIIRKIEEEKNVEDKAGVCREPMKLFCKDDQALICVVCNRSKDHRDHDVVPVEEAAREYKEKIQAQMQPLQKKRENIVQRKLVEEQKKQKCLTQVGAEKHGVRFAFKQMQKFLKENERRWLAQLEDLQREIEKRWKDNVTSLSEESSCLGGLIAEMEGKCQQPASEFLQDIKCTLSRCQEGQLRKVVEIFSGPEEGLRSYSQKSLVLKKVMEKFEESLEEALNKGPLKETRSKVNVILDPNTAHPFIVLTEDLTSMRWEDGYRVLPDNNLRRFDREFCVLGCESFTSGSHWWEVEVEEEDGAMWALGVARESVRRKGIFRFSPNEGIWAVGRRTHDSSWRQIYALTSPEWTPLVLSHKLRKIQVSLDYEEGHVEFFDADTNDLIFTFSSASFSGETIRPFFQVVSGVRMNC